MREMRSWLPALRRATAIALAAGCLATAPAAHDPKSGRPAPAWDITLAPRGEPGEPFEMAGTVRNGLGVALANRRVYVYHADARGMYGRGNGPPRLADTLVTDAGGRYRVRSVFPGSYGGYAAHVHFQILGTGGGPGFVNVHTKGRERSLLGQSIAAPKASDGVWRLALDLRPGSIVSAGRELWPGGTDRPR